MPILVTGSCGLIGSEAVEFYAERGEEIVGIDNNMRKRFFGPKGDTSPMRDRLRTRFKNYHHEDCDIRNREAVLELFKKYSFEFVIHAASQPSHDWAAREPLTDFEVNALGTLNLLESMRLTNPDTVFCFLSTNKVYGDAPNHLPLKETDTRWDYFGPLYQKGIDESLSVDQCLHSLFGASKLSADVLCQEYGRYFQAKVGIFRGGCLTGSKHAGVPLHGFLHYLIDCAVTGRPYEIIGYKGKQVRDQIHSKDVIRALDTFRKSPRRGEVYNLGGGYSNSASIIETISRLERVHGIKMKTTYVERARIGDHICYYTNMEKFFRHYPNFKLTYTLDEIVNEMVESGLSKETKIAA